MTAWWQSYDGWVWDNPQPVDTVDYVLETGTQVANVAAVAAAALAAAVAAAEAAAAAAARAAFMRAVAQRAAKKAAEEAADNTEYFRRLGQQYHRYDDGRR